MNKLHPKYRYRVTEEFGTKDIILDLGVGNRKVYPFSVGLDIEDSEVVDILADATLLIPIPDNSVTHCYSYHMLEHITASSYRTLFKEVYRVCAPESELEWWVPYWTHHTAFDFNVVTRLNEYSFNSPIFQNLFSIDEITYEYEELWQDKSEEEKSFARTHYMNVVKDMKLIFRPRK